MKKNSLEKSNNTGQSIPDILIKSSVFVELDTFSTKWRLDDNKISVFFNTAKSIDNIEAAEIMNKKYHPFAIEGEFCRNDTTFSYTINPSGVAIVCHENNFQFLKCDEDNHYFFNIQCNNYPDWKIKILSRHKFFEESAINADLAKWAKTWMLTVSQINQYLDLCKKEKQVVLSSLFLNVPCFFSGYAVWSGDMYIYNLECFGMTRLERICREPNEVDYGFGCYDKRGLDYIYSIENNMDDDQ